MSALINRYRDHSDPLRTERRVELAAVLVTAVLLLQLLYSALRPSFLAQPEPIAPSPDILAEPAAMSVTSLDPSLREEITARPLFWASRRWRAGEPATAEPADADDSGQETELEKVQLVGIFGAGESAGIIALVKGKKRRILLGEELEGWTLKSIQGSDSGFARAGRRETLTLRRGDVVTTAADADSARGENKRAKRSQQRRQEERDRSEPDSAAASRGTDSKRAQPTLSAGPRGYISK